jgi:hypothetical protein
LLLIDDNPGIDFGGSERNNVTEIYLTNGLNNATVEWRNGTPIIAFNKGRIGNDSTKIIDLPLV